MSAEAIATDVTATEATLATTASEMSHEATTTGGFESLLSDPATWVLVAFVIFIALFVRYLLPLIGKSLDSRAATIHDQLEQANRLRAEAQELLASFQREQESLLRQAETIIETAKRDAAALRARAAEELTLAIDRRSTQAQEKIAQAQAEAVSMIRTRIIETATDRARDILQTRARSLSDEQALAPAFDAIERQVH